MDLAMVKAMCGLGSVIAGICSCLFWYSSSKAVVLFDDVPTNQDEIGIESRGQKIAMYASTMKQSNLSARGAFFAAVAAGLQLVPTIVDAWKTFFG